MRVEQRREFFDRKDLVFHLKHTIFELSVIELLNAKQQWPDLLQPRSPSNGDRSQTSRSFMLQEVNGWATRLEVSEFPHRLCHDFNFGFEEFEPRVHRFFHSPGFSCLSEQKAVSSPQIRWDLEARFIQA